VGTSGAELGELKAAFLIQDHAAGLEGMGLIEKLTAEKPEVPASAPAVEAEEPEARRDVLSRLSGKPAGEQGETPPDKARDKAAGEAEKRREVLGRLVKDEKDEKGGGGELRRSGRLRGT
jgi:hypothetical protein